MEEIEVTVTRRSNVRIIFDIDDGLIGYVDDEMIARHAKIAMSTHGLARFTDRLKRSGMTFHAWYMHTAAELPLAGPKGRLP